MAESKWMTEKGITYATSLNDFVNSHNMTNDEFMNGGSSRSHHALGGTVPTTPLPQEGASNGETAMGTSTTAPPPNSNDMGHWFLS